MTWQHRETGFTLAELLIALGILGIIATFSIPKVLQSQQDSKYGAIAKETASSLSGAFQQFKLKNGDASTAKIGDLTPFLNYVAVDSSTTIDNDQTMGTQTCSLPAAPCLKLHNGAMVKYSGTETFCDTSKLSYLWFDVDPDGIADGTTNAKAVTFVMYYDGRLTTWGQKSTGSLDNSCSPQGPAPTLDPPWFSW